ncbi:phage tail protein [Sphingomonas olei]|nr:phage tail protein [uncultured Sphingomonas sp.]
MATLVLTTVGGLAGGPIGAALGGMLGQAVDRNVLFRPKGRHGPRLNDLAVQTSRYGQPIPRLFGRMRVAGHVIWATDLVERRERQGGSKGQPAMTRYAYSASVAVALSARAIRGVGRIWADGNLLRGAAGDWKVPVQFRLHLGSEDQAADPLIASAEGGENAPAHRGIAYAVFEDLPLEAFGNRIPSLTFEVIADDAPVPAATIAQALAPAVIASVPGDEAAMLPIDGFSAYGDSVRSVIETLAEVAGAWFVPIGDRVAMRGDPAPARMLAGGAGQRRIAPPARAPHAMTVSHYDPARDWQAGVQRAVRPGALGAAMSIDLAAALPAERARAVAETMLARTSSARATRRIVTDIATVDVLPGSVVSLSGEAGAWRVRSVEIERFAVTIELVALPPPVVALPAASGRVLRQVDVPAGQTIVHVAELPAMMGEGAGPTIAVVAAGSTPHWRRAMIHHSIDDGASWTAAGATPAAGTIGTIVAAASAAPATLVDRRTVIEVSLAHDGMMLTSMDAAGLDRGGNLALVGDELLQFGSVEQVGACRWRLSDLWRGRFGTTPALLAPGDRFVILEREAMLRILPLTGAGGTVRVMARGVGDEQGVEAAVRLTGAASLPLAPVHLSADIREGALALRWRRRSRVDWWWCDHVDVPLGEEREAYEVTVTTAIASHIVVTAVPYVTVPLSALNGAPLRAAVRQIGSLGASSPATLTLGDDE